MERGVAMWCTAGRKKRDASPDGANSPSSDLPPAAGGAVEGKGRSAATVDSGTDASGDSWWRDWWRHSRGQREEHAAAAGGAKLG
jgi:hypothetical protein